MNVSVRGLAAGSSTKSSVSKNCRKAIPALYQRVRHDIRRAVLHRFPYGLFYLIDGDRILVLACFHLHRKPLSFSELLAR